MPELYFATFPQESASAARWGHPLAHMAYGMGSETLQLTVGALNLTTRGGWMVLTDKYLPVDGDPRRFAVQVRQEYLTRRYTALLLDFERPVNDRAGDIIDALSRCELHLILPAAYATAFPASDVLIDSAISGGDFADYLAEQRDKYPNRVCLSLHPLCMRFPLPSESAEGTPIDRQELDGLRSYFSHELGCRYVTQQIDEQFYFTLFDDADSLRYKLQTADRLGIRSAVGLYQELEPFLPLL